MANTIITKFPFTGEVLKEYLRHTDDLVISKLHRAEKTFQKWSRNLISERIKYLSNLIELLEKQKSMYASLITLEMGKPLKESIEEIEKCIWLITFYKKNALQFLADKHIETDAGESFIRYDPMGCIMAIMPWNYPFWQVMRFAIPAVTAGNTALLKHAENVSGCALAIQELFEMATYPEGCLQTLLATHQQIATIIEHDIIKAVSLTGSEKAGKTIAEIAGKNLKKTVLELGGNNACIIWDDADLDRHIPTIVNARMQNAGQSCIAAKRFIVTEGIYQEFLEKFKMEVQLLKWGNPLDPDTDLGTLAREDLAGQLQQQVDDSIAMGAKVFLGNHRKKAFYEPTILTEATPGMPIFDEEIFGPVATICKAKNKKHTLTLAGQSRFGLGTMLFTEDIEGAKKYISHVEDGAFFINEMVKSDPRLPFGGTKASGYGRELSQEGILEFVNKKTVYVK